MEISCEVSDIDILVPGIVLRGSEMGLWASDWIMRALIQSVERFIDELLEQMDDYAVAVTGQLNAAGH